MDFLWPHNLWWMLALPLLSALYLWLLGRRAKPALRLSSLRVVHLAAGRSWRRHVPPAPSPGFRCWTTPPRAVPDGAGATP